MNAKTTPENNDAGPLLGLGSNAKLGPLVERADKARALLFGMRDSDPGCTVTTWW